MILRKVPDEVYDDCVWIQTVLFNHGVDETLSTCETLWRNISFHHFNQDWMYVPRTDAEVWSLVNEHARVIS